MVGGWEVPFLLWVRNNSAENELRVRLCKRAFQTQDSTQLVLEGDSTNALCVKKAGLGLITAHYFMVWRWEVWRETVENSNII